MTNGVLEISKPLAIKGPGQLTVDATNNGPLLNGLFTVDQTGSGSTITGLTISGEQWGAYYLHYGNTDGQ